MSSSARFVSIRGNDENGYTLDVHGVEAPTATVLRMTRDYIVAKTPGSKYWSGIGLQGYAAPEVDVYRVKDWQREEAGIIYVEVEQLMSYEVGRKPPKVTLPTAAKRLLKRPSADH